MDASWTLQRAVFARLDGDAALKVDITGVYDQVPSGARYPYISLGASSTRDWSTKTYAGQDHRFDIHIWSKARGHGEVKRLMEHVARLLDDADLMLDGHELIALRFDFGQVLKEPQGPVHHAIMRYRALTHEILAE